jgi:Histidine phosphatase superfamily (branch 1)
VIVRHAETDGKRPVSQLTAQGFARADLLAQTLRGVKFSHVFASHTVRSRQQVEKIADAQKVAVVQLPAPGSMYEGKPVTDETTRRAAIEPIAEILLKLPAGSTALVGLNSENIYAILNKLGVPVAPAGQSCAQGSMCVPCLSNQGYPKEFDHLWHVVRQPGRAEPLAFLELRYGAGWPGVK